MSVLVTGAAGFIGFHVSKALLERGEQVIGIDNLSPYYDVELKKARLEILRGSKGFSFETIDIADNEPFSGSPKSFAGVDRIVHLAAQAGVRHSLTHPHDYIRANLVGHLNILEFSRTQESLKHLVYASSSSVYGTNRKLPFSVDDRTDTPVSLYGATKKADELMSHSYSYLYKIPATGLRFFTVYGPWGRPDMALFLFTKAILAGDPIRVFNFGEMMRDFTYIDDIVAGTIGALDHPASDQETGVPHAVYNLGKNRSEPLMRMIELLENCLGQKAEKIMEPIQPGDVAETFSDIEPARRDFGFDPKTSIEVGIPAFVDWYRDYFGIA